MACKNPTGKCPSTHLKTENPELWERVTLLMDHNESMKDDEKLAWQSQVIDPIQSSHLRSWSVDEILRTIGIINTNGVSLGMVGGCGLYPTFSFLSHRYSDLRLSSWLYHSNSALLQRYLLLETRF